MVEANQIIGWQNGIRTEGSGKTFRKNVMTMDLIGILASGSSSIVGNVIIGSRNDAVAVSDTVSVVGNTVIGNKGQGNGAATLLAANNYSGAPTGPGPHPADNVWTTRRR